MSTQVGTSGKLKQELFGFQIFFITLSVVIGSGIFTNNGTALAIAGPMGLIVAALIMSVVILAVNECVAELTQQFPVYNAIVIYVRKFVDDDLGWVIGVAYWYAYAATFASQSAMAATLLEYWGLGMPWRVLICYVLVPVVLFLLNMTGVFWYGLVETFGGFLKLLMILSISIYLYAIADDVASPGFKHGQGFSSDGSALCYAIPLTAYAFQGIEVYAMTAFEARDSHALRWPSRWTANIVVVVYIMCTLGEIINIKWHQSVLLPRLQDGVGNSTTSSTPSPGTSQSMVIIAALNTKNKHMAGFLNGCLLFSVFSAANTSLYVASRTLWGIAESVPNDHWIARQLAILSKDTRVPVVSLLVSLLAFCWVPFLDLVHNSATKQVIQVISISGSNAIMLVWAAICLAFIRYYYWYVLKKCGRELGHNNHQKFVRLSAEYTPRGSLLTLQPLQAWIGLIGCLAIFAFSSATWWGRHATITEVAMAYGTHIVLLVMFVILKARSRKKWVKLTNDWITLWKTLDGLWDRKIDHWEPSTFQRFQSAVDQIFLRYRRTPQDGGHDIQMNRHPPVHNDSTLHTETSSDELRTISTDPLD
ncbi:amino acid transporter [Aspergillus sclerotiicarbonarius CBS 121057]|uniref:Amino acid transporter n=1 Tax=Aspergillus sclerotiicarbonarius (strain CBS 121057 / IBT 28362) TaxID=1448318 RepID=A0A319ETP2_ASPSB|nr:amino acid transporter [Aspergillus sclerotiicarbonarius CBS 121057]